MNKKRLTNLSTITFCLFVIISSCKKEDETEILPMLATLGVYNITTESANSGGLISESGSGAIIDRGVCWNTQPNPTIDLQTKTIEGEGVGSYTSSLENLLSGTKYYIRAYATNEAGTAYGNEVSFSTIGSVAEIETSDITNINFESAVSGGTILHDGGSDITLRGVCWGLNENPVIETNMHTEEGTGTGSFVSQLTNLQPGRLYYLRAYAKNENGISYGNELSFETEIALATLETNNPIEISYHSAKVGGKLINNGGDDIQEMGLCFSTSTQPTLEDNKITVSISEQEFSQRIENLESGKTYYVRSFATNAAGTSYGNEVSFTTLFGDLQIGSFFKGGIIFYIDESGEHGLVCTTEDQTSVKWGCENVFISGTSTDIGTGLQNTNAILAQCSETNSAAKICADLVFNGYDDWFLPSKDELNLIYSNLYLNNIGRLGDIYRSSSEYDGNSVWTQYFIDGQQYNLWKGSSEGVRAVRAF